MSVLVKGMEMPENCYQCRFYNSPCAQCKIIGRTYMNTSNQPSIRPEWCPLVDVAMPHGRLVGADALDAWVLGAIDRSSAVIEAEAG